MPYYHVFLDVEMEGEKQELDLSKDGLLKFVVKPYLDAKRLFVSGKFIDPFDITTVEIFETYEKATKVHSEYESSLKPSTAFRLFSIATEDAIRAKGTNVTKRFITHPPRRVKRTSRKPTKRSKNVFIVHGKDHEPMKELKAMLKDFGLKPIVLHEQPSGSRTIVEKLEKYSDVGYAFIILTPDDIGTSFQDLFEKTAKSSYKDEALDAAKRILEQSRGSLERFIEFNQKFVQDPEDASKFLAFLIPRARQNVILEFGYFIGKLDRNGIHGRDRVCCLLKGDVERPSDMQGIAYHEFKESLSEVRDRIIKELREAGYEIKV